MSGLRERADASAQVLVDDLDAPVLADADDHHLRRVLRLRDGERIVASDGRGAWRLCAVTRDGVAPSGEVVVDPAPQRPVAVWLPALKGERAEWAVQKLTELGVDEIGLLRCEREAGRAAGGTERVLERWRRVVREASCQARRTRLPHLAGPLDVAAVVARGVRRCELDGEDADAAWGLAVGPEGGWSDAERPAPAAAIRLADAVLRTETAAVTAGALLVAARRHAAAVDAS